MSMNIVLQEHDRNALKALKNIRIVYLPNVSSAVNSIHCGPTTSPAGLSRIASLYKIVRRSENARSSSNQGVKQVYKYFFTIDQLMGPFGSNVEIAVNLLRAQVNSAFYPQMNGKWVVVYGLWGESLVWLTGAVLCPLAGPWVQLFAGAGNKWPHNALLDHSAHANVSLSAAASEIIKRFIDTSSDSRKPRYTKHWAFYTFKLK